MKSTRPIERLGRVARALDNGQQLTPHVCMLSECPEGWPKRWQSVLSHLTISPFVDEVRAAKDGTALRHAQSVVRGGKASEIQLDASLRYVQSLSQTAAVEFVAATLAHSRDQLDRTVILCEDDQLAMQLDACLNRYGVPTMGASVCSSAHPALQVLPLALALCWQPVDPQCLLDFLTLPICPIPRRVATKLASALTQQPGLGSTAWEQAVEHVCSSEADPDGEMTARIDLWLFCDRVARNSMIPTRLISERCAAVAQWARGFAIALSAEQPPQLLLVNALHTAAAQATLLGDLVQSQGREVSEPQLTRLIEEAISGGVEALGAIEAENGPLRIRSLAEIVDNCHRVIWLGLGTSDAGACRWSADQLHSLRTSGVDVDDGTRLLSALRSSEARGLCKVEDALLAVLLPQDAEKRWHPMWLAIRSIVTREVQETAPVLEQLIQQQQLASLAPFTFPIEATDVRPPPIARPLWSVDPALLRDRDTASATELEDRLACPLKWVLRYRANVRPSSIAQLPDDYQLKGTFCHEILERAFNGGEELPTSDEGVARVEKLFDARVELDAAPLAQSDRYRDRQLLRKELAHATRVLLDALASGGYRIKGIEVDVGGQVFGKPLVGSIDCLIEGSDGNEGIIDFKYGGKKYERMIAEGRACQLATYAYSRSSETGRFPAVAYLVLSDGLLYTPSGGPISGDGNRTMVDGPSIQAVWDEFHTTITGAETWLNSDGHIPARPLQSVDSWPAGLRIVLDSGLEPCDQAVCRYCDYQLLCGQRQLI